MLTSEVFKLIPDDAVISSGETTNDPDGVYMTDTRSGDKMKWFAKKGYAQDWCIYIHWAEASDEYVLDQGDKVNDKRNIQKLVPCDDAVYSAYRR